MKKNKKLQNLNHVHGQSMNQNQNQNQNHGQSMNPNQNHNQNHGQSMNQNQNQTKNQGQNHNHNQLQVQNQCQPNIQKGQANSGSITVWQGVTAGVLALCFGAMCWMNNKTPNSPNKVDVESSIIRREMNKSINANNACDMLNKGLSAVTSLIKFGEAINKAKN